MLTHNLKKCLDLQGSCDKKNFRIRETPTLLTDADSRTNTIMEIYSFFWGGAGAETIQVQFFMEVQVSPY